MSNDDHGRNLLGGMIGGANEMFARFWIFAFLLVVFALISVAIGGVLGVEGISVGLAIILLVGLFVVGIFATVFFKVMAANSAHESFNDDNCEFIRAKGNQCANGKLPGERYCARHAGQ